MNNRWEWQQWKKWSSILLLLSWRTLKKTEEKYLELGWELQSTGGLIFILILLGSGNRGRRTCPNKSFSLNRCAGMILASFRNTKTHFDCEILAEAHYQGPSKGFQFRASGLRLFWCEGKVGNTSYSNQTMSKDPEQSNSAPLPFMPYFASSYSTTRGFEPMETGANLQCCSNE